MNELSIVYVMAYRQLRRYVRARSRLVGTIINPIIFLIFFGMGWSALFRGGMAKQIFYGLDYVSYLAPGIYMMTIFTASFIGGISVIWDREFGFLKEILVAPASRTYAILGRTLGDSFTCILQGLIILIPIYFLAPGLKLEGLIPVSLIGFVVAIAFNSLGIAIASKINSMEGFQLIINLIMWPLIFLSGAFYPIQGFPDWIKFFIYLNPMTYGVSLSRGLLTGVATIDIFESIAGLSLLCIVFLLIGVYLFKKTSIE